MTKRKKPEASDVHVNLVDSLAAVPLAGPARRKWILCPWRRRFRAETDLWISVLAAHDANGALFDELAEPGRSRRGVYAAVFAVDPFRLAGEIVRRITRSAIDGVINFPSISFIDGAAGATFESLSLGSARELEFLGECAAAGLRVAGVARTPGAAERLAELGADFVVAHGGPPTSGDPDPSLDAARRISKSVRSKKIPIVPLSLVMPPDSARRAPRIVRAAADGRGVSNR